jgi:hypothetical protein
LHARERHHPCSACATAKGREGASRRRSRSCASTSAKGRGGGELQQWPVARMATEHTEQPRPRGGQGQVDHPWQPKTVARRGNRT